MAFTKQNAQGSADRCVLLSPAIYVSRLLSETALEFKVKSTRTPYNSCEINSFFLLSFPLSWYTARFQRLPAFAIRCCA